MCKVYKKLDNLHPRNFNRKNPGSMLNREIYVLQEIPGIQYLFRCQTRKFKAQSCGTGV